MDDKAQLEAMSTMITSAFTKAARDMEGLGKKTKETETIIGSLKSTLIGPLGLTAVLYGVSKAIESVAEESVQLQAFARNTGFAAEGVENIRQAMRRMGQSTQEANQSIAAIGSKLQNLGVFKEYSQVWQDLVKFPGGVEFANRLKGLAVAGVQAGDQMAAFNEIIKTFNEQSPQTKIALSQTFGVAISTLEDYAAASKRGIHIWEINAQEAKKYHSIWVDYEIQFDNIWKRVANHGIEGINKLTEHLSKNGVTAESIAHSLNNGVDYVLKGIDHNIAEAKVMMEDFEKLFNNFKDLFDGEGRWFKKNQGEFGKTKNPFDTLKDKWHYPQGEDPMGRDYTRGNDTAGPRRINLAEDDRSIFKSIWETLLRIESNTTPAGEGGFGGGARGGSLQASLGGFRPGGKGGTPGVGGKTTIGKGGDPRGLADYIRETAQKYGVDPETALAVAKSEGLARFSGDGGTSFGAFQLHTGGGLGDTFRKETGLDPSDPANERATIDWALKNVNKTGWGPYHGAGNTGIGPRAGLGGPMGGGKVGPGASLQGVNSDLVNMVRAGAKYLPEGYTIRPTSGAIGRSGPGYHPSGQASDWQIYTPDGRPIPNSGTDSTGLYQRLAQGAYTDMLENNPQYKGKFAWGGAFETSAGSGRRDLMHFDLGGDRGRLSPMHQLGRLGPLSAADVDAARSRVDKRQSATDGAFGGKINASVEFLNVPFGVRTQASSDGDVFDTMNIKRTRQAGTYEPPPPNFNERFQRFGGGGGGAPPQYE